VLPHTLQPPARKLHLFIPRQRLLDLLKEEVHHLHRAAARHAMRPQLLNNECPDTSGLCLSFHLMMGYCLNLKAGKEG
jgi:hypothetical protein